DQMRIYTISIYGKDSYLYHMRPEEWYEAKNLKRSYGSGFIAPLGTVAEHILLHTVDDASIFSADVGQPLWYAEHLRLYDADGLVDTRLAHAPSTRGDIPTIDEFYR